MIVLILVVLMLCITVAAVYLLGFRLGTDEGVSRLRQLHEQAIQAQRSIHALTRAAFVAMAEEAHRHRRP